MTIEEKAKAYDAVVNKLRCFMKQGLDPLITRADVQDFFPELLENEDERIRKWLINYFQRNKIVKNIKTRDILAWLEKQGKMQSTITWHSVNEIPNEMRELLCEWESEDSTWHEIAFYHTYTNDFWNGSTKIEGVTKWIYIDELLEKLGEQNNEFAEEINYVKCKC